MNEYFASNQRAVTTTEKTPRQEYVVSDPHVVYYDAVLNSPWNESGGATLPARDDWSTYRCASKDIIVGVVTHRYNRQTRRLDIRAYFVGEHPVFKEMEPTRILMIVLCSQAYQAGGSMALYFEQGIPFDVRLLIEARLGIGVSGLEKELSPELCLDLYASLSDFPPTVKQRMVAEKVPLELICFNTFRGTWSASLLMSLLDRGVPLRWLFKARPNPVWRALIHAHLVNHLRVAMMEEYAIHRLADRKLGAGAGKVIKREGTGDELYFVCDEPLSIPSPHETSHFESDSFVTLAAKRAFVLIPVLTHSATVLAQDAGRDIVRAQQKERLGQPILILPLDFVYLAAPVRAAYREKIGTAGIELLIIGLTMDQLLAEAEFNLAITTSQLEDADVEEVYGDRYAD